MSRLAKDNKSSVLRKKRGRAKLFKGAIIALVAIVVIFSSMLIFVAHAPYSFANSGSNQSYFTTLSSVEGIKSANPKINQLAFLGSHDSFSDCIKKSSQVDPADESVFKNKTLRTLTGELVPRFSVTQRGGATEQLKAGARYFDIRLSYVDGKWWTKHFLLSAELEKYILQLLEFLAENNGEVVLLDFQHVYTHNQSISALFDFLYTVEFDGKNIYDYVFYSTVGDDAIDFASLRYNDVTNEGLSSGVVMFVDYQSLGESETEQASEHASSFFCRFTNVQSLWHNSNSTKYIFSCIEKEAIAAESGEYQNKLVINQTQKSLSFRKGEIFGNISGWSLLHMAEEHNIKIVNHPEIERWLKAMPVFMVDFVSSNKGDFNKKINAKIFDFNSALCSA